MSGEGNGGEDANGCGRSAVGVTGVVLLLLLLLSLLGELIEKGGSGSLESRLLPLERMRHVGVLRAEVPLGTLKQP